MNLSLTPPNIFKDRRLFFEIKKSISESDLSKIIDQSQISIKTEINDFEEMIAFSDGEIDLICLEEDNSSQSEMDEQENLSMYSSDLSNSSSSSSISDELSYSDLFPKMNPINFDFQSLLNSTNDLTMLINTYKEYIGTECDFLHFLMDNYSDQEYMDSWTWRIYGKINGHTFSDIILDILDNWNIYCDEGDEKYQLHVIRDDEYCYDVSIFDYTGDSFNIYSDDSPVCIYTVSISREEAYDLVDMAYYNNNVFFNSRNLML